MWEEGEVVVELIDPSAGERQGREGGREGGETEGDEK